MSEIDKVRKKLEEAKTIEEKRLVYDVLLRYVDYLQVRYVKCIESIRRLSYAVTIIVPLNVFSLLVSTIHMLAPLLLAVLYLTSIGIVMLLFVEYLNSRKLMRKIYEIYDLAIDPGMVEEKLWPYLAYGIIMLIVATIIFIIGLTHIGIIHL